MRRLAWETLALALALSIVGLEPSVPWLRVVLMSGNFSFRRSLNESK